MITCLIARVRGMVLVCSAQDVWTARIRGI